METDRYKRPTIKDIVSQLDEMGNLEIDSKLPMEKGLLRTKQQKSSNNMHNDPPSEICHPAHPEHKLKLMDDGAPFMCNGCKEPGYGPSMYSSGSFYGEDDAGPMGSAVAQQVQLNPGRKGGMRTGWKRMTSSMKNRIFATAAASNHGMMQGDQGRVNPGKEAVGDRLEASRGPVQQGNWNQGQGGGSKISKEGHGPRAYYLP
ncbi:unnamed protein product [Miscanthus lutarioriparius]|uniref:Uncharacterized protein n=1 Tax=Miscanthus lutarioriparius TaxID=422564 RepID=A0A811QEL5_9POAL|nr:unnamed protein product [Miscanthus lutarioriparius]